jgi:hypothetical protein
MNYILEYELRKVGALGLATEGLYCRQKKGFLIVRAFPLWWDITYKI